ncbi:MAG: glycoside hydrolase family 3 C-terminal domain-containing protein [Oscillospiraceae bacterium]|nr:glycoside hydrolase family 3 C-terminal domain-containing protein [Oscillospiraceae bacterium]
MDIESIIDLMMVEEKAALVSGTDFMYTNPIPRFGIPSLCMSDGPHGLRHQKSSGEFGVTQSEPATAFPTAACTASGWDPENLRRMGAAIAEECRHYGVHTLLGPGVNIKRNPLCGRNFEYFSEDPLLAGTLAAAMVEGVQSGGVGVSVKHFAMNNTENNRFMGNSVASEKTMREIYLKPFEQVVRQAKPATMMCAYNKINDTYCSENRWLLTDVLRDEWGFDGVVMSDWGAVHDRVDGLEAGLDLEMPGDTAICRRRILDAVADGSLPLEVLNEACRRILRWIDKYVRPASSEPLDWEAHHALAGEIAADCAVLMKNDGVLPLKGTEKLFITGPLFETMRYQGAGSSMINPTKVTTPKDAFDARGIASVPLDESDVVLVFAGLTDGYETEGRDRADMRLPEDQLRLIDDLCYAGKKIVVVLFGGSPVELPFCDSVCAILNMYLPGQNGGEAVCNLLFGEKNPSGKLAETWPMYYEDVPGAASFGKQPLEVYAEGCEVGYRYYNRHNVPVRFPFGFGLSYTTFESGEWVRDGDTYTKTVTNTGDRAGAEVAQLYIDGELAGFEKVFLAPGETKTVSVTVEPEPERGWSDEYEVPGEAPRLPITLESRFTDLKLTFFGRKLYNSVVKKAEKQARQAEKLPDGPEKEGKRKAARFMRSIIESSSLRSMTMSAGKTMPYNYAEAFVEIANGHLFKGLRRFLTKVEAPTLPKDK